MANKDVADFHRELKALCVKYDVFLQSVEKRKERPNGPQFVDYRISAKVNESEGEIDIMESRFSS